MAYTEANGPQGACHGQEKLVVLAGKTVGLQTGMESNHPAVGTFLEGIEPVFG